MWIAFIVLAPLHLLLGACGHREVLPPRFLRLVGWLAGLRVRLEGRPAKGKLLLLANHLSWLDIIALSGASGAEFVAHGGLAGHPFLKWLCDQNGTVFIARDRRGSVSHQAAQVRAALKHRRLAIFPEGTTSDGHAMLPFKSALLSAVEGLDEATVRVQPVVLQYRRAGDIAWHGGESGRDNVLRMLARVRPIALTVRFLHPLSGRKLADRKTMAAAAQDAIARSLVL